MKKSKMRERKELYRGLRSIESSLTDSGISLAEAVIYSSFEIESKFSKRKRKDLKEPAYYMEKLFELAESLEAREGSPIEKLNGMFAEIEVEKLKEPPTYTLDRKVGECVQLTALYLSLGELLGVQNLFCAEVYGPPHKEAHAFVKYKESRGYLNIETTDKGSSYPDKFYEETYYGKVRVYPPYTILSLIWNNAAVSLFRYSPKDALRCANRAIKIYPQNGFAWYNKAVILLKLGDYNGAMESLRMALKLRPELLSLWLRKVFRNYIW